MKTVLLLFILVLACHGTSQAQTITQIVQGTVRDGASGKSISGATVTVQGGPLGMISDKEGHFMLRNIPVGRYNIMITAVGYEPVLLEEILVSSVQQTELSVSMKEKISQLDDIVIKSTANRNQLNSMAISSARQLSAEQASRYAGGFDDPARLVASFAGVSSNISSNGIVVRGNSPNSLQWRLEGVEIPNPNHFADLDGFGGGALTALSSRLLANSDFLTGAFPASYNNALSGVFDISMRKGNNEKRVNVVELGIIGLDVSAEGPFKKEGDASYLFNYRYSTLGLIGPLIGNDAGVTFQDLSFKLHFPTKRAGTFSLWGIGLLDHSGQELKKNPKDWEYQGDKEKENVDQYMGTIGLGHELTISDKSVLKTTLAATTNGINMKTDSLNGQDGNRSLVPQSRIKNAYTNFILSSNVKTKFSRYHTNQTGFALTGMQYRVYMQNQPELNTPLRVVTDADGFSSLLSAYTESTFNLSDNWTINGGVNAQLFTLNNHYTVEPRLAVRYQPDRNESISLAYGLHSRLERLNDYFIKGKDEGASNDNLMNKNLDFTKAHHIVLGYDRGLGNQLHFKAEAYYQSLFSVPVIKDSSFSLINLQDDWFFDGALQNTGKGRNYGIDLTLEKYMTKGFYWMLTGSVFRSEYMGGDHIWRDTRYNKNYVFNLLAGKEWQLGKFNEKSFGINVRLSYQGGDHYSPLDIDASLLAREAVFNEREAFSKQYDPALTTHLTINYKINRKRTTHEIALKIINANGYREHFGFEYNYLKNQMDDYRQALFIPNLSYKITF